MKEIRKKILENLEYNAKINVHDLAAMLNASDVDVANELEAMEKEHIICGYLTLINWDNTDKELVTAFIGVKVNPTKGMGFDVIANQISSFEEVNSVYLMSGEFDFYVLIEGKTMKEVSSFVFDKLSTLESVLSTATHFVLRKYKDHGVVLTSKKDKRELSSL